MPQRSLSRSHRRIARDHRLLQLGYPSYGDYTSSPEWWAVKQRYRVSSLPQDCVICGASPDVMHHKTYDNVGQELIEDLAPLCKSCHSLVHELERRGDLGLDFDGLVSAARAERNRPTIVARKARQRAEYIAEHKMEIYRRKTRSLSERLRQAMIHAHKRHVEVDDLLEIISRDITALERRSRS